MIRVGPLPRSRLGSGAVAAHRIRRAAALIGGALVACALVLAPAPAASAHDYLVGTSPKAGSVQAQPLKSVTLTFDDVVLDLPGDGSSSPVQVTGPDGATAHFETACPTVKGRAVTAPVALGGSGAYLVTWQIVSTDGHAVSGHFTFHYQPPSGTPVAKGTPTSACSSSGSGPKAAPPTAGAADGSQTTGHSASHNTGQNTGLVIGIASGIVGFAVVGVIVVLFLSRGSRRRAGPRGKQGGARWHPEKD